MESKEDSIKILEMRIQHQMNHSLDKNIKSGNMQYYLSSSAMPWQEGLQQNDENGGLRQAIHDGEEGEFRQEIRIGENGNIWQGIPVDEKADLRQGDSNDEPEQFDQQQYEKQPFDASEYIERVGGLVHMMEYMEISQPIETQRARARNGYERARRSLDKVESSENGKNHFFDTKG